MDNWKQLGKESWHGIEYYKDKYSYARSFKTGLPSSEVKRRGIKPFIFVGRIGINGNEIKKYFKSKKEADKSMFDWMKTH